MPVKPAKPLRKLKSTERVDRWRDRNPELYKKRQRTYQAEYRRRQKEERPAK